MLIPPNENVLLLAERWLKLLSDLGRALSGQPETGTGV